MPYRISQISTYLEVEAPTITVSFELPPNSGWAEAHALLNRLHGALEPGGSDPLRAAAVPATAQPTSKPALATEVVDEPPPKKGKRKPEPEPEPIEAEVEEEEEEDAPPPPKTKGKKIALTDEMRAMKFRDLITHLINVSGIKSKRELVKWCTANVEEVASLGKIAAKGDMTDRINSTAEFVDPDMDD